MYAGASSLFLQALQGFCVAFAKNMAESLAVSEKYRIFVTKRTSCFYLMTNKNLIN